MITYTYKAKRKSSETVAGEIVATTQEEALELIEQLGLLPVSIEEQNFNH